MRQQARTVSDIIEVRPNEFKVGEVKDNQTKPHRGAVYQTRVWS